MALLSMGVLYFVLLQLEAVSQYQKEAQSGGASDSLVQAREALLGYAATYRDTYPNEVMGYLPCPDTTGDGVSDPPCGAVGDASVGLLPFKTLGLPDLRDSTGGCLWYAVAGSFKNNPKATATVMNWDTQGQFRIRDAGGATLVAPDDAQGGAAAVVFAPGPPLTLQNRSAFSGEPCRADPSQVSAHLDGAYNFANSTTIALTQGPIKDANGDLTNNDRLAWVTPKEIFDRVVKRQDFSNALTASPAGHLNKLTDEIRAALEKKIQDDLVAGTTTITLPNANRTGFTQFTDKLVGSLPAALPLNDGNYTNYYDNWSEGYRQTICSTLGTPCLTVAGTACRGALMFSGATADGRGRPRNMRIRPQISTPISKPAAAGKSSTAPPWRLPARPPIPRQPRPAPSPPPAPKPKRRHAVRLISAPASSPASSSPSPRISPPSLPASPTPAPKARRSTAAPRPSRSATP
jgi:hypothetical protein